MGIIYIAVNITDGGMYVGQSSKSLEERQKGHRRLVETSNRHLYKAIRKYGWGNFSWVVIDEAPEEELDELEIEYIAYYRSIGKHLYNETDGGSTVRGYKHTEETKRRLSISSSVVMRGKPKGAEHVAKIAATKVGNQYTKGMHWSEETRKKISVSVSKTLIGNKRGVGKTNHAKTWATLIAPDGSEHGPITNLAPFCRKHDLNQGAMSDMYKGKRTQHKGWRLKNVIST